MSEHSHSNLSGWERILSIGAGLALAARGADAGGPGGAVKAGLGGLLVLRGVRGHCTAKGLLLDPEAELRHLSNELQRLSRNLESLASRYAQFKRERDISGLASHVREAERLARIEAEIFAETEAAGFDIHPPRL
ncbi:hypothetical protein [Pseudomonas sp. LRF_L74]|uniref:hypothetical protein n=1 Tax=Pseudomonas sp. LRF_L74 TaxID=3369422 RepID=UPI003F5EDFC4